MTMPTKAQVRAYTRGLGFNAVVSISGKTLKVYTAGSRVSAPYDIGNRFADKTSCVTYSDYTVTIRYD